MALQGKKAIVTGGSKGIGRAVARLLGAEGAEVALAARSPAETRAAAAEIVSAGGRAHAFCCDLSDSEQAERMVDQAAETMGGLDILVNNAAWWSNTPFLEVGRAAFRRECGAYLESLYFTTQRAARRMRDAGAHGSIVNIASTAGFYGEEGMSLYCAGKAAVINLTRVLALELGRYEIRVNAVAPGTTVTDNEKRPWEVLESFRILSSLPRLNRAEDIAPVVLFLAGDASRGVTGQTVAADAGFSSCMRADMLYRSPVSITGRRN